MRIRKVSFYLLAVCCVLATSSCVLYAQEDPTEAIPTISTNLDLAYVSKYIWRGIELNPDAAVQPSLTVSHPNGLSFNFWGSMDTTDVVGESGSFTEIDYTLSYEFKAADHDMTAGLIYYAFPNTSFASTSEVFAGMCFGGALSPTLSVNYDFDEADGYYLSLSGGYACPTPWSKKAPEVGLSAKVSYGSSDYNEFYYPGVTKGAFTDALFSASMPIAVNDKVTITPSISYSLAIDGDVKDSLEAAGLDENNFFIGVTASSSF